MPKFVWLKNALLGPMPSVLHDDAVFGVTQDKDLGILQKHDINDIEAHLPLASLSLRYPFVKVDTDEG